MTERLELTQNRFPAEWYCIDGEALNRIYRVSILISDGHTFAPDERRNLAQEIQVLLTCRPFQITYPEKTDP